MAGQFVGGITLLLKMCWFGLAWKPGFPLFFHKYTGKVLVPTMLCNQYQYLGMHVASKATKEDQSK